MATQGAEGGEGGEANSISEMKALVMPFQKVKLGSLKQIDPYQGWGLSTSMSWSVSDDPDAVKWENEDAILKIESETAIQRQCEAKHDSDPSADPIATTVERTLADGGGHFVDLEFAPCAASIATPGDEDDTCTHVTWRRATDFLEDTPAVFEDAEDDGRHSCEAIEASDIRQGALGDCWFMCALASCAEFPTLVRNLFVTDEYQPTGCYRVRFSKGGLWREVTIDDYFPCYQGKGPVFSRGVGDELWVLMLEKAYAKLHGSYYALRGGLAAEGLMDLTGCPTFKLDFDSEIAAPLIESGQLFHKIANADSCNLLMCCSTPGKSLREGEGESLGRGWG